MFGNIFGWLIWSLTLLFFLFIFITFLMEVFFPKPFPSDPETFLPINFRRVITGFYGLIILLALLATSIWQISKFHLLWFVPPIYYYRLFFAQFLYFHCFMNKKNQK